MKSGFIKAAAISPRVTVGNVEKNCNEIINMLEKAKSKGVQIAVFPEMSLCGYTCGDLFLQNTLLDACLSGLAEIKEYSIGFNGIIIVGAPLNVTGRLYNCGLAISKGKILGAVPKTYIPNYSEYYEKRWFASGKDIKNTTVKLLGDDVPFGRIIFELNSETRLGIEICEDLWVPCPPSTALTMNGANIIVNLSASNESVTKNDYRRTLISQQSARCFCGYVYSSAGVGESSTDLVFSGACTVAENGGILNEGERFSLDSVMTAADLDIDKLNSMRAKHNTFFDGAPDADIITVRCDADFLAPEKITRKFDPHPFVPSDNAERDERCREILTIQSSGLAKRMLHTGIEKLVVGISGGLDSTLALLVCVRTMNMLSLPAENIICITMPGFGTTDLTYTNACGLVKSLGATLMEIDIKKACVQHMEDIGHDINIHDITYENTQARERTQILMDMANKLGALLVGTGDLSELALGWCTYNGDHMSMYSVNASVPKTLVRHLVKNVADRSDNVTADILYSILETPVSPELLPPDENGKIEQKTESTLGPYEVHDFYLYHFLRFGTSPDKLLFMAKSAFNGIYGDDELKKWLQIFIKRFFQSQFKRSCLPDGPKVGSVTLSPRGDWRMPSDASYAEWLKF